MFNKSIGFNVKVDGDLTKFVNVVKEEATNLLQYLQQLGKDIPHFCYHERLGIAGNCRMCLVQTHLSKKLQVACSLILSNSLIVITLNNRVKKSQESVLGFLLSNHPLDCPICDQGGECDLQDLTLLFGADRNNFYEMEKRAVLDKNVGVLVKTSMNRCIHCMRCVRFYKDIVGSASLGVVGRGFLSEIDTYADFNLDDELSGNIIDLCPVGALTSKVYLFQYRVWEFHNYKVFDFLDVINSEISFNVFGNKLIRVLPEINYLINENWISNKTRFAYDILNCKQLSSCLWGFKRVNSGFVNYIELSHRGMSFLFLYFLFYFRWNVVFPFINVFIDLFDLFSIKAFWNVMGVENFFLIANSFNCFDFRNNYSLYWGLEDFKNFSACFLIGFNPRMEYPILNIKLRELWLQNRIFFFSLGTAILNNTYNVLNLSKNLFFLIFLLEGRSLFCRSFLYNFYNFFSFFILGSSLLKSLAGLNFTSIFLKFLRVFFRNVNYNSFLFFLNKSLDFFSFFTVLPNYSSFLIVAELGLRHTNLHLFSNFLKSSSLCYLPVDGLKFDKFFFYLYGAGNWSKYFFLKNASSFVVFQGQIFENLGFAHYDLIIPAVGMFEKYSCVRNLFCSNTVSNKIFVYDSFVRPVNEFFNDLVFEKLGYILKNSSFYGILTKLNCFSFNGSSFDIFYKLVSCFGFYESTVSSLFLSDVRLYNWGFFFFSKYSLFFVNNSRYFSRLFLTNFLQLYNMFSFFDVASLTLSNLSNNNYLINYFEERDSFFVKNSKTMNLCMLSYSKKNFSFLK